MYDMGPVAMKGRMIQRRTAIPTRGHKMYDMGPVAMKGRMIQRRTAIPTREDTIALGACSV